MWSSVERLDLYVDTVIKYFSCSLPNSGKYACQIWNERHYIQSHSSMVSVHPASERIHNHCCASNGYAHSHALPRNETDVPLYITVQPLSQQTHPDSRVMFQCAVASRDESLRYQWHRKVSNGQEERISHGSDGRIECRSPNTLMVSWVQWSRIV